MADDALDTGSLRRDRDRYHGFLLQAEQQLANCNERIQQLHQAIEALDRLLALTADGPDAGVPPAREAPNGAAGPAQGDGSGREPQEDAALADPAPRRRAAPKRRSRSAAPATAAPSATATPAAPDPVEPPGVPTPRSAAATRPAAAGDPPKGTDALRLVLESEPTRTWSLAELLDALGARGWLPSSRRPEEGVRISLKRLAERGGAVRVADGRWRHPAPDRPSPNGSLPAAGAIAASAPADDGVGPHGTVTAPPTGDGVGRAGAVTAPPADESVGGPGTPTASADEAAGSPETATALPADEGVEADPAAAAGPADAATEEPTAVTPPAAADEAAAEVRQPPRPAAVRPTSFGLPVGGTVTEL